MSGLKKYRETRKVVDSQQSIIKGAALYGGEIYKQVLIRTIPLNFLGIFYKIQKEPKNQADRKNLVL